MTDEDKTKEELTTELTKLRQRIANLEAIELEYKRTKEELEENKEKLNAMLQSIGDHMSMMDNDLNIIWANETAKRLFGNDIIGKKCFEVYLQRKEPCEPYPCITLKAFQEGKVHEHYTQVTDKNDRIISFHCTASPALRDKEGKPTAVIEICKDIADLKEAEEALRETTNVLNNILKSATEFAIVAIDLDFHIFHYNPAAERMLGNTAEEILGRTIQEIYPPEKIDPERFRQVVETVLKNGKCQFDIVSEDKSGKKSHIHSLVMPMRNETDKLCGYVLFARDVTHEKELKSRLLQSQKMEAMGTLAGGIAHDFNNILSPIFGYGEMTLYGLPEDSSERKNLEEVLKAANRAKELVQQILSFSRPTEQKLKALKVQLVIKEALKLIRSSIPSTIEIHQNIDMNCGSVMGDPTQINQIMMNLCTNAYHAMQDTGGKLEVNLSEVDIKPENVIEKRDMESGRYLRLSVSDTGHGIDRSVMERIFDPYYTTKEEGRGTGLGLSVVHGIVKNHGGDIRAYSEPGKGTAFHVYLPLVETRPVACKTASESDKSIPTGHEHILLVDDEQQIVEMEQQMLEKFGYHVTARASSVEALETFRNQPEKFDLVITDMTMPDMTGDRLVEEIRQTRPDIPVILCTGFSERMTEEKAKALGINGFLMKPVTMRDLTRTVRNILAEN